jgi:hypothetical protein
MEFDGVVSGSSRSALGDGMGADIRASAVDADYEN